MSTLTPERVNQAFLAAPPYLAQQILDLSIKHPNFLRDIPSMKEWPVGVGNTMQQLIIRGAMPQIERGFEKWAKKGDLSGCEPCEGDNCSYNWTTFPGHGIDRKTTSLMSRDFRTPNYCIKEIQSTAHFREVFAKVVENMFVQIDFFKQMNLVMNGFSALSKKFVVDSAGPKGNTQNPYVYRNVGAVVLSNLNIELCELFYEQMRRIPSVVPYDVTDGAPIYSLIASQRVLARMYRDDPNLRQDTRFSGLANDMLMKYNFMSTIRGMFIGAPILWPRRFKIVAGEPVEILPFVNDVPSEVGAYTDVNPDYLNAATHEEVIFHGKYPFEIFYQPTETALPGNASFGPEYSMMQNWNWINPLTTADPARREGFFFTSATIGFSQQFSDGMFAVLVTIPSNRLASQFDPVPITPPVIPPVGSNVVPAVGCPCPMVMSITADPFAVNTYDFVFSVPVTGVVDDPINFALDNGTEITGNIEAITADGFNVKVSFANGLQGGTCANIISVFCTNVAQCSAVVASVSDCRAEETDLVHVIVSNPLAITAGQVVIGYMGDCTDQEFVATLVDPVTLTYSLAYNAGFGPTDNPTGAGGPPATNSPLNAGLICDRGGISFICVPTSTNAACPGCAPVTTVCSDD